MNRKVGRPREPMTRDRNVSVRINENENNMLMYFYGKDGETYSDIFRKALRTYYNLSKNQY